MLYIYICIHTNTIHSRIAHIYYYQRYDIILLCICIYNYNHSWFDGDDNDDDDDDTYIYRGNCIYVTCEIRCHITDRMRIGVGRREGNCEKRVYTNKCGIQWFRMFEHDSVISETLQQLVRIVLIIIGTITSNI